MTHPLVSVIIPVYNCRDTVARALESVFDQSLPPARIEVIAVDDGSTDGSAEVLDELARTHDRLTVLHQPNSGGAGAPRNRALELATGEFVFFLDADDRLGPEALERMTAMAERNGTDIVLGKQVGTGGRKVPRIFERNIDRVHVLDPGCDLFSRMSMAALQLFRRSLIERAGLRFTEGLLSHEDQLFTAGAYLHANAVSVLADYDCYYWAARTDGTSSTQAGGAAPADVYAITTSAIRQVVDHTDPGEARDQMLHRYLRLEVFGRLDRLYLDSSSDEQKISLTNCRELLKNWYTPELLERSDPYHRVLAHCVLGGFDAELTEVLRFRRAGTRPRVLLEDGRSFLKYPYFRDAAVDIPDTCFEITKPPVIKPAVNRLAWEDGALVIGGTVVIRDVDEGVPAVHLLLDNGEGARLPVRTGTTAAPHTDEGTAVAFTATIHPESDQLPEGRWTISAEVSIAGHVRTVRLTKARGLSVPRTVSVGSRLIRVLPVRGGGKLAVEAGGPDKAVDLRAVEVGGKPGNGCVRVPRRRSLWGWTQR